MIQEVGNVELFELFETDHKTQRKACLPYWSEGIVYCTCGHLLRGTVSSRRFVVFTLDLSIPEHVSRRENFMATDMVNFQEAENIFWPII